MGFLIPAALAALAFVAGPIVAHLVRRRGVDVLALPTVRYLHAAATASSRRRRIVDVLLLLLRIAAVVALALAAAQPFRALSPTAVGTTAVSAVFVVDDSHSMRARRDGVPLVSLAVARALDDLAALPPGSVVSVVAAGDPPRVVARRARSRDVAEASLRALAEGSARGGGLREAIERAHGAFEPGLDRHLFVYSDFAAHESAEQAVAPDRARVHVTRLRPDRGTNRRLVEARVVPSSADEAPTLAIEAVVETDESERGRFAVGVFDGEAMLARGEGALDPNGRGRLTLRTDGDVAARSLEVRLLGDEDGLPQDDVRHALTDSSEETRVLVVDGKPRPRLIDSASGFFRAALANAPARDGRFSVRVVDEGALDDAAIEEADVLVFADVHAPNAERFARVVAAVERGAGLLVSLGPSSDPFAYTGLLGAHSPGRILAATAGERAGASSEIVTHDLGELRVARHFSIEPGAGSRTLLTLSGAPVAVEGRSRGGAVTLLGLPLDDSQSNFPYLPAYLPTVVELVSRLSPPKLADPEIAAGEEVSLAAFLRDRRSVTVETPSGRRVEVTAASPVFTETGEAGVYRVDSAGGGGARFVVAPPLKETDLTEGEVLPVAPAPDASEPRPSSRVDLTPWIAALGALLLALEGLLRTRSSRQARSDSTTRGVPPRSGTTLTSA